MELTQAQKHVLYEQGFIKLPGIVPQELVHNALHAIHRSLGSQGIDPAQLTKFRAQSYCPEIQTSATIIDLLMASPLWGVAESEIGQDQIEPVKSGQIALRFPGAGPAEVGHPHIDGVYTPTNGVARGEIWSFTMLVGVFLSDIPHDFMGNFTVWPGSHHRYEQYFREQGPQSLLDGMPPVELPQPVQVTAKAGDAALVHYQLGHSIAANVSPFIRYGIFFRLKHRKHEEHKWECMTDIWREWPGMHDLISSNRLVE